MNIERKMLVRAVVIAGIVGPILITINQGSDLLAGAGLSYLKAILTMIVPFAVSLVSSLLTSGAEPGSGPTALKAPEDAGRLLAEILANAQKVNAASSSRHKEIEALINATQQLRASLGSQGLEAPHKSVEELLAKLDMIRIQVDVSLEGSAANIQLAQSGVSALEQSSNS